MSPPECPEPAALAAFRAGRLPAADIDRVAAHLDGCAACGAKMLDLDGRTGPIAEAARDPRTDAYAPPQPAAGTLIAGRYKLIEPLGEGGMGAVWMAQQTEPVRRAVAVKLIKPGMDSAAVLARFEAERQALALMDHPNIAKILDAGQADDGRPFFVMELVKGVPITDYCDQHRLTPKERLERFVPVCQAVQHAHQKGVIHRDIKPNNVLVARYDGVPVPKVIDFGVAKATGQPLTDRTLMTGFGAVIGTPEYMAPEQAEVNQLDIDTRADVYALGVLLYELLTGTTPLTRKRLRAAALMEILRLVREDEQPPPSSRISTADALPCIAASRNTEPKRLSALLRGELDWVVMKALEKDRARRYETANGLARDLQRYLSDEPVEAGRPTAGYRLRKFARRYRRPLRLAAGLAVVLIAATAVSVWMAVRANEARMAAIHDRDEKLAALDRLDAEQEKTAAALAAARAEEANRRAVQEFYEQRVFGAARPKGQLGGLGNTVTLRQAIDAAAPTIAVAFKDQPVPELAVRNALAETYFYLGATARQVEQAERAHALATAIHGPAHRETLRALRRLTIAYRADRRDSDALRLTKELVEQCQTAFGPDDPDTLQATKSLAVSYFRAGRKEDAVRLNEELLPRMRARFGADNIDTLGLMANLAVGLRSVGRAPEAHRLTVEAFEARKSKHGLTHPDTLTSLSNLAASHAQDGRLGEAVAVNREALRLRRSVLDPDHPDVLTSLYNLGGILRTAGRVTEAVGPLEECYRLTAAKHQNDHQDTLECAHELAAAYLAAGRPADARPKYAEYLAGQRRLATPDKLAADLAAIGGAYLQFGRPADAEPLLRESLTLRGAREPDAATTFHTRVLLGGALTGLRKYPDAEPLLRTGYDGLAARRGKLTPGERTGLASAADWLTRLSVETGRPDQADHWRAERAKYPPERAPHPAPAR